MIPEWKSEQRNDKHEGKLYANYKITLISTLWCLNQIELTIVLPGQLEGSDQS